MAFHPVQYRTAAVQYDKQYVPRRQAPTDRYTTPKPPNPLPPKPRASATDDASQKLWPGRGLYGATGR